MGSSVLIPLVPSGVVPSTAGVLASVDEEGSVERAVRLVGSAYSDKIDFTSERAVSKARDLAASSDSMLS